ncbi:MAG: aspartate/glutamate racemase family protein [Pseudomonadota bacterium]
MNPKGKTVGVLMLETQFPRLRGDIGNPDGFEFPIIYKVVDGASPKKVVEEQNRQLVEKFIKGAKELIDEGANIITTSCGFLGRYQNEIQAQLPVPVFTSALLLMDGLEAEYGKGNVGILTISKTAMTAAFLAGAGIDDKTPIGSTETGLEFTQAILANRASFDEPQCKADLVQAALNLVSAHPNIRAILLECTNMPPHAAAIEAATGLPVSSLNDLLNEKAGSMRHLKLT